MACSSCGRARTTSTPRVTRNTGTGGLQPTSTATKIQVTGPRVQTPVASNPNAPHRTKI